MTKPEDKLCVNCKNYRSNINTTSMNLVHRCVTGKYKDLVTGNMKNQTVDCGRGRGGSGHCGKEGKHFKSNKEG